MRPSVACASTGVLTLVFQDGHGEKLLGFHSIGGVTSWLPLFLFVILFGLSMDCHVFIISRIREAVDGGTSTDRAVAHGIKQTAGVVTSAAIVMVAVFSIFATLSSLEFKQMGVGLAGAVLIAATVVRAMLLPATMKLLGDWNWYLPRRLGWLPRLEHERTPGAAKAWVGSRRMRAHAAGPLLLLLLFVAGCGGGGLSKKQLVAKADAICTRVNKQVAKQPDPKSNQDLARVANAVVKVSDPAIKDMEALDPPSDLKDTFTKFVADLKRQRDLTKQLGAAAGAGDTAKIQKLGSDARKAQTTYRGHAAKLGFKVCGGGD